ncbi:hypothetical protein [Nocardioides malaquae]|nr:hypothetical protein [Nocardioides malaquae]
MEPTPAGGQLRPDPTTWTAGGWETWCVPPLVINPGPGRSVNS